MTENKSKSKKYFVKGMHCASCEVLIEKDVNDLKGVSKADVSLKKSTLEISANSKKAIPNVNKLNEMFEDLGYTFYESNPENSKLSSSDVKKILGIFAVFLALFFILERTNFFMRFSLSATSSAASYFVFGIVASLSSCAALVGGLLLSVSKNWEKLYDGNPKKSVIPFTLFNVSRLVTFAVFGGLLGLLGGFLQFSVTSTAILTILISLLMFVIGMQMIGVTYFQRFNFNYFSKKISGHALKNTDVQGKYIPLFIGALTFFIPCGFTLIAQTNVLGSGSFLNGSIKLFAFALGTLPVLLLISFSSLKFYSNPKLSKKFSLFSGLLLVFFALHSFNSQLNVLGFASLSDLRLDSTAKENNALEDEQSLNATDLQIMQMEAKDFEYYPKTFTIKSGIKTQWDIYDSGAFGCAKAVYARGLYNDVIYLEPGLNSVEFVAPQPGTYKISCSMGMVDPVTVYVL